MFVSIRVDVIDGGSGGGFLRFLLPSHLVPFSGQVCFSYSDRAFYGFRYNVSMCDPVFCSGSLIFYTHEIRTQ